MARGAAVHYHFQKKNEKEKRERETKKGNIEKKEGEKLRKSRKKIITNNLNVVYKWIKTDELLLVTLSPPIFF